MSKTLTTPTAHWLECAQALLSTDEATFDKGNALLRQMVEAKSDMAGEDRDQSLHIDALYQPLFWLSTLIRLPTDASKSVNPTMKPSCLRRLARNIWMKEYDLERTNQLVQLMAATLRNILPGMFSPIVTQRGSIHDVEMLLSERDALRVARGLLTTQLTKNRKIVCEGRGSEASGAGMASVTLYVRMIAGLLRLGLIKAPRRYHFVLLTWLHWQIGFERTINIHIVLVILVHLEDKALCLERQSSIEMVLHQIGKICPLQARHFHNVAFKLDHVVREWFATAFCSVLPLENSAMCWDWLLNYSTGQPWQERFIALATAILQALTQQDSTAFQDLTTLQRIFRSPINVLLFNRYVLPLIQGVQEDFSLYQTECR